MANWKVEKPLDSTNAQINDGGPKYLKATGVGSDAAPYVVSVSSGLSDGTSTVTLTTAASDGDSNTRVGLPSPLSLVASTAQPGIDCEPDSLAQCLRC